MGDRLKGKIRGPSVTEHVIITNMQSLGDSSAEKGDLNGRTYASPSKWEWPRDFRANIKDQAYQRALVGH